MPKVSVIIPCYNYAHYLPDAVGSVLSQSFYDLEVIIVDDGSTDNTAEVAARLAQEHGDARLRFMQQVNRGVSAARNNGIAASSGEFIVPLDADDMLRTGYIERLVEILDSDASAGFAYSWGEYFGDKTGFLEYDEFNLRSLVLRSGPPCTMLIRRPSWVLAGGYDVDMLEGGEDWDFLCRLYEAGISGRVLREPLFKYRVHGPSRTDNEMKNALKCSKMIKLRHPGVFEPGFSSISVPLAKAVIRLKSHTRDPIARFVYVNFPKIHAIFRDIKYTVLPR